MLPAQAEFLGSQCFIGDDGVPYCVLKLVLYAQAHYRPVRLATCELAHEFESGARSNEPDGSPEFVERALAAEDYPLLVQLDREGGYHVMDGRHRLWKALHEGRRYVDAFVIPIQELPESAVCAHEIE